MSKALVIKSGSVRVKVFTSRSGRYTRHEIRWTDPNLATKADAEKWFALLPPKSTDVIIPLSSIN